MLLFGEGEVETMRSFWCAEGRTFLEVIGDKEALARLDGLTTTAMPLLEDMDLSESTLRVMRYIAVGRKYAEEWAERRGRQSMLHDVQVALRDLDE